MSKVYYRFNIELQKRIRIDQHVRYMCEKSKISMSDYIDKYLNHERYID